MDGRKIIRKADYLSGKYAFMAVDETDLLRTHCVLEEGTITEYCKLK